MPEIGATLREARMRARIDVSEIEAQTKIRAKYLRALENEEWDLLPGPTYVKSFLKTYAQALGLDAKALLEDYRIDHDRLSEADLQPIMPAARRQAAAAPARRPGSRRFMVVVGVIVAVIVVLVALDLAGGGGTPKKTIASTGTTGTTRSAVTRPVKHHAPAVAVKRVSLQLKPTGPVYVCLLAARRRVVIPGVTLQAGSVVHTYRSTHFDIRLGNNSLTMRIDGHVKVVPPTTGPIGYTITPSYVRQLPTAELPVCAA